MGQWPTLICSPLFVARNCYKRGLDGDMDQVWGWSSQSERTRKACGVISGRAAEGDDQRRTHSEVAC